MNIAWTKLIGIIIAVVFLLLAPYWLFFSEDAPFKKVGATVKKVVDVKVGINELNISIPKISSEEGMYIKDLLKTIKVMKTAKQKNCFEEYYLPEFGEKGTSMSFSYNPQTKKTYLIIMGGAGGTQEIHYQELKGNYSFIPCTVSYPGVAKKFYDQFFSNTKSVLTGVDSTVFKPVYNAAIKGTSKGNMFYYSGAGLTSTKDKLFLKTGGFLYTPDNIHICFLPFIDGDTSCKASDSALYKGCVYDHYGRDFLRQNIGNRYLNRCTPKKKIYESIEFRDGVLVKKCDFVKDCNTFENKCGKGDVYDDGKGGCNLRLQGSKLIGYDCDTVAVKNGQEINRKANLLKIASEPDKNKNSYTKNQELKLREEDYGLRCKDGKWYEVN